MPDTTTDNTDNFMTNDTNDGENRKPTPPVPKDWNEQQDLAYLENWMSAPFSDGHSVLLNNLSSRSKDLREDLQRLTLYFHHEKRLGLSLPIELPTNDQTKLLTNLIQNSPIDRELAHRLGEGVRRCGEAIRIGEAVIADHFVNGTSYWLRELFDTMLLFPKARMELTVLTDLLVGYSEFNVEKLLPEYRDWNEQIITVDDKMFDARHNGKWNEICGFLK